VLFEFGNDDPFDEEKQLRLFSAWKFDSCTLGFELRVDFREKAR
jgi:hypothetical protein